MTTPFSRSDTHVLMAIRHRVGFLEYYAAEGFWDGIPVQVVADGATEDVLHRLQSLLQQHPNWALHAYLPACGVGFAKAHAIQQADARHVVFCDDDDVMADLPAFIEEGRSILAQPEVLFATVPRLYAFDERLQFRLQYDRAVFDGKTGRDLLAHLARTGEMSALVAGSQFRRADLLDLVPEPFFKVSEDYVLLARLCARYPERRIVTAQHGRYLRLIHAGSLSARPTYTVEKAVMHLVAMCVGAYYLIERGWLHPDDFADLLCQRGTVLQRSYGLGEVAAITVASMLQGGVPDVTASTEARAARDLLHHHEAELPREFKQLCRPPRPLTQRV